MFFFCFYSEKMAFFSDIKSGQEFMPRKKPITLVSEVVSTYHISLRVTRSGDFSPKKCYRFWLFSPPICKSFGLFFAKLLKCGLFLCQNSNFGIFGTFWLLLGKLSGSSANYKKMSKNQLSSGITKALEYFLAL